MNKKYWSSVNLSSFDSIKQCLIIFEIIIELWKGKILKLEKIFIFLFIILKIWGILTSLNHSPQVLFKICPIEQIICIEKGG